MDGQKELQALRFMQVGAMRSAYSPRGCRAELHRKIDGFVVYALVVGDQIVKFGKTSTGITKRIGGHASALDGVMRRGKPINDPFKRLAPAVLKADQAIEVWARESTAGAYASEELELNLRYQPAWVGRPG